MSAPNGRPHLGLVLRDGERVSPLELFFDLVFVLAITQCTALMAHDPTWRGIGHGLVVLGLLWWAWVGYAWLTSVVDPDEGGVRLVLFAAMAALLVTSLAVPEAFGDLGLTLAVAYGAVRAAHIALFVLASRDDPGLRHSVIGLGVSGLLLLQLLRAAGLRVMGVTRSQWKRELAERLGAEGVVPPQEAASAIAAFTGGEGVDIVVEAVGTVDTWAQAIELAGAGAEVLLFGTIGGSPNARLPLYQLYYKELTIRNPRAARHRDYERAIALATEGMVKLAPLWTHGYRLEQAAEAFTALRSDPRALKVTLEV